jgi:2,3,4,5-tetrahydropyridine-2-carboxylate N-succinyltransferase
MNWEKALLELETGSIRSAHKNEQGEWVANKEVKEFILEAFKHGKMVAGEDHFTGFYDKDTIFPQQFSLDRGIRIVPGGTSIRRGSYVAEGVIVMPPSYINIGAYVDSSTMVDSHVLVGSCAQIGKNVHLSAGVQIGGVLEPIGLAPVVVEDNVFIGAGSIVVEGIVVRENAILAPGVTLSKSVAVYDSVEKRVLPKGSAIPENAVVVPGTRPLNSDWGRDNGLQVATPIIIKYRDAKTDASLVLEDILRN